MTHVTMLTVGVGVDTKLRLNEGGKIHPCGG